MSTKHDTTPDRPFNPCDCGCGQGAGYYTQTNAAAGAIKGAPCAFKQGHRLPLEDRAPERFWAKVDTSGGPDACWPWTGATADGYGRLRVNGTNTRAHHFALVRHICHNRLCCNPYHLLTGTHRDNMRDKREAGRASGQTLLDADLPSVLDAYEAGVSPRDIARSFDTGVKLTAAACDWYQRLVDAGVTPPLRPK